MYTITRTDKFKTLVIGKTKNDPHKFVEEYLKKIPKNKFIKNTPNTWLGYIINISNCIFTEIRITTDMLDTHKSIGWYNNHNRSIKNIQE